MVKKEGRLVVSINRELGKIELDLVHDGVCIGGVIFDAESADLHARTVMRALEMLQQQQKSSVIIPDKNDLSLLQ